jgi:hypothetical protein
MLTALRNVVLFSLALAALLRLVDTVSPAPTTTAATAKLRQFRDEAQAYDTIFVGNSHVYRHLVPRLFDAEMAERGHEVHSYNLAAPGMTFPEMDYVIRQAIEADEGLRRVVIGASVGWHGHEENLQSERSVAWHDARGTWLASTLILHGEGSLVQRNDVVNQHLSVFFSRETRHGRALDWLRAHFGHPPPPFDLSGHERGFLALDEDPDPSLDLRRGQFVRHRAEFRADVKRLRRRGREWIALKPSERDELQDLVHRLRQRGIEVVFFHPPLVDREVPAWQEAVPEVPYFVFNDPQRFGPLYQVPRRFDRNHMNSRGAAAFTRVLADSIATTFSPQ